MVDKIELGRITAVVDCDTGMYHIGEVDGGFKNSATLRHHIEKYGSDELLATLAYMTFKVVETKRALNAEKDEGSMASAKVNES